MDGDFVTRDGNTRTAFLGLSGCGSAHPGRGVAGCASVGGVG